MIEDTTMCVECGASILSRTAAKNNGRCVPCATGTRAQIDEGRRRAVEERERERINQQALDRLRLIPHPTFAHFLEEEDPIGVLWSFIVEIVFQGRSGTVQALSPSGQVVHFVQIFAGEVFNGGLHQYFSNSSGEYAHEALAALNELRATQTARLLQQAIAAFPGKRVPKDWARRNEQLAKTDSELLNTLDSEYYALADSGTEDLAQLLLAFMTARATHPIAA
jgi:hypothetical protein